MTLRAFIFLLLTPCIATHAYAQEKKGSAYLITGIVFPFQSGPNGDLSFVYLYAPGGITQGWSVGGGVFVTNRMSVEGEFANTGLMTARETDARSTGGRTIYNEERSERFFSGAVRFYLPLSTRVRLEPVVGIVITDPQAWTQSESAVTGLKGPRQERHPDTHVGLTFGCDFRAGGRHVGILSSVRVSHTGFSGGLTSSSCLYCGGYPTWTIRPGVALRVDF